MATPRTRHTRTAPARSRPRLVFSYGVDPTKTSGMLRWNEVQERLADARNYWLATTRANGRPHVMPVWGLWMNAMWLFSTDAASVKGRNLARDPRAVVHLESGDDVVVLEGRAEMVTERALLRRFADAYERKYRFRPETGNPATPVYALQPAVALAWHEMDFPGTATRWRFSAAD